MVAAVASSTVLATMLGNLVASLRDGERELDYQSGEVLRALDIAYRTNGLSCPPKYALTNEGRIIHAALSGTVGIAAAQWLSKLYQSMVAHCLADGTNACKFCPQVSGCGANEDDTCAEEMFTAALLAALTSTREAS
jgi:hypothetical protein